MKPYKSTTHEERFIHLLAKDLAAYAAVDVRLREAPFNPKYNGVTVFLRKEAQGWFGEIALCIGIDQFCRKTGRLVSRRKYFQGRHTKSCAGYLFGKSDDTWPTLMASVISCVLTRVCRPDMKKEK